MNCFNLLKTLTKTDDFVMIHAHELDQIIDHIKDLEFKIEQARKALDDALPLLR